MIATIDALERQFDELGIDKRTGPTTAADLESFEDLLSKRNALAEEMRLIGAYVHALTTTDSRNELAQAKDSELDAQSVRTRKLGKRFVAWIGSLDLEFLLDNSEIARDHAYALEKTVIAADHQMDPDMESLSADLELTGIVAWGKLHGNITSQMEVPI
jgi:oligoendopeptidase F